MESTTSSTTSSPFLETFTKQNHGKKLKPGAFQTMGLAFSTLKAIKHMGYQTPTPIQRKTIPLLLEGKDVVGMARTGSGKTAAFLIPLVEKLKQHSPVVGARAVILSPTRELALQTYKFVKSLTKYSTLRTMVIVGGDSMETQFNELLGNPDILIATPGRLLHLVVETKLELTKVVYVVLDEADRLFELGFEVQLVELLHRLPTHDMRQTVLFSATLPKSLVEFAKAGLKPDPVLVRLDTECKLPKDLEMSFFTIKPCDKEALLLFLLRDIIQLPTRTMAQKMKAEVNSPATPSSSTFALSSSEKKPPQVILFVATKHHVEYLNLLLTLMNYSVSFIYGSLDQDARQRNHQRFVKGEANVLIVTDVAARGIDIPVLDHVINFDFPSQSKVFIHRVGRVARAGRRGWAWNFVSNDEMPFLLDLELFLSRPLFYPSLDAEYTLKPTDYMDQLITGGVPCSFLEADLEWIKNKWAEDVTLTTLKRSMDNGYKQYLKSRPTASSESHQRYKLLLLSKPFGQTVHPLLAARLSGAEQQRQHMLLQMTAFRPPETVFEMGRRGVQKAGQAMMQQLRRTAAPRVAKKRERQVESLSAFARLNQPSAAPAAHEPAIPAAPTFQDPQFYLNYVPPEYHTEKGYQATTASLAQGAQAGLLSYLGDETSDLMKQSGLGRLEWDTKKKKFKHATLGADNKKLIKGESGVRLPATFQSDRFELWKKKTKKRLPRVGARENEEEVAHARQAAQARRFKHHGDKKQKKAAEGKVKSELKSAHDIAKARKKKSKKTSKPKRKKGVR